MSQHDEPQEQERWKRARFQDCVAIPFPTSTTDDDGLHCLHGHAEVDSGEPTFSDKMDAIGTGDLSEAVEATLSTQTFEPFDYLYRNYKEWHVLEMLCGMPPGSAQYGVFTDAEKTHITGTLRQRVDRRAKKMQPGYKRSKHVVFCPTFQAAYEHLATEFEEKRRLLEAASALEPRSNTATEQARRNLDEWTAELHNLHFGCYYHIDNYLPEGTRNNTCRDVLMLMVANHLSQPQAYTILLYYLVRSPLDDVNDRLRLHIVTRAQSLHSTRFDQLLEAGDPRYNRLRCTFTQTKQERDRLVERTAANEVVLARMFKGMRAEQVSFKEKDQWPGFATGLVSSTHNATLFNLIWLYRLVSIREVVHVAVQLIGQSELEWCRTLIAKLQDSPSLQTEENKVWRSASWVSERPDECSQLVRLAMREHVKKMGWSDEQQSSVMCESSGAAIRAAEVEEVKRHALMCGLCNQTLEQRNKFKRYIQQVRRETSIAERAQLEREVLDAVKDKLTAHDALVAENKRLERLLAQQAEVYDRERKHAQATTSLLTKELEMKTSCAKREYEQKRTWRALCEKYVTLLSAADTEDKKGLLEAHKAKVEAYMLDQNRK